MESLWIMTIYELTIDHNARTYTCTKCYHDEIFHSSRRAICHLSECGSIGIIGHSHGCLEAYCSATGVARTAREFLEVRTEPSLLRNIDIEEITSKDVYDAAIAGDKIAKDIFEFTGKILGEAMADMTAFSSPQAFVLFGGLTKSGDLLMKPLKEAYDKNVLPIFRGKAKILLSELKESDAAVLGASALGWEAKYRYEVPGSLATSNEIPAVSPEM